MSTPKGYAIEGKRDEFTSIQLEPKHNTFSQIGVNKYGMDFVPWGMYEVSASATVEAGSDDNLIVITGHSVKKGDFIRVLTTSNSIEEEVMGVREVVDANSFSLNGRASANFAAGDTVAIYRPVFTRVSADGATLATVTSPPIQILKDGVATTVTKDTGTPANTVPVPVEVVSASGTEINITAGDLNVQLTHLGANADSVRVGDGTNIMGVNASLEALVKDTDAETAIQAVRDRLPASLGQAASAASLATVLSSEQEAILDAIKTAVELLDNTVAGTELQVDVVTSALPTGAATEAKQDSAITQLTNLNAKDFATQTTLAAVNAKLAALGQKASAGSMPVVLSTEQEAILSAIQTAVELLDNTVSGSELQVDVVTSALPTGAATEASLASVDGKLPASLGAKTSANSLSVVLASDSAGINVNQLDVVDVQVVDFSSTNVSTSYVQITADSGATAFKAMQVFMSNGNPLYISVDGGVSHKAIIVPGGSPNVIVPIAVPANSDIQIRTITGSSTSGTLLINWMA